MNSQERTKTTLWTSVAMKKKKKNTTTIIHAVPCCAFIASVYAAKVLIIEAITFMITQAKTTRMQSMINLQPHLSSQ